MYHFGEHHEHVLTNQISHKGRMWDPNHDPDIAKGHNSAHPALLGPASRSNRSATTVIRHRHYV